MADYQHALTLINIVIPEATANLETVRVARQQLVAHFATPIGVDRGRGRVDYERHAMQLTPLPDFAHYARRVGWIAEGPWPNRPFEPPQHIENEENVSDLLRVNYATQVRNLLQEEHNWETLLDHAKTRAAAVVPALAYA